MCLSLSSSPVVGRYTWSLLLSPHTSILPITDARSRSNHSLASFPSIPDFRPSSVSRSLGSMEPTATPVPSGAPTVTFVENSKTVANAGGVTLRKLAKANGVDIQTGWTSWANCMGNGLCGTCRVNVDPAAAVTPPTFFERFTLGKDAGRLRLACQTKATGEVKVKIKPALDYADVHRNVIVQSALIGMFSLIMVGFLAILAIDLLGIRL
jgi:ferredoxin